MNNPLRSILKARRVAIVALAVAAVPFATGTANAATSRSGHVNKHASSAPVAAPVAATTTAAAAPASTPAATPAAAPVSSVIAIGGYVFYNMSYTDAVDAWFAAVAAAPAGYTPPAVYSVSVDQTVSGTVEDGNTGD